MIYRANVGQEKIIIDDEDLQKIEANSGASLIKVKNGIINPKMISSIVVAKKELQEYRDNYKYEIKEGVKPDIPVLENEFETKPSYLLKESKK